MAVYKRGYHRYQGPIRGRWARIMVLPRFAWRRLFQQRLVLLLLVVSMIWPLLCAVYLYLGNNIDLLKGMRIGSEFLGFIQGNNMFFLVFMNVQAVFAVFLAALTGPGCIAPMGLMEPTTTFMAPVCQPNPCQLKTGKRMT